MYAQISPGDLSKYHSKFEGMSNCTECHDLGKDVSNQKCIECHTEIKSLIENNRGYHSSEEVKKENCYKCHSEHFGREFQIIRFDKDAFDHNLTGYKLTGKHADTDCANCHKADFILDDELKKDNDTFLGLEQDCKSCHDDFHRNSLGENCADCHGTESFRPAPLFDHSKSQFKLTGAHQKVDCEKCHPFENPEEKDFQKFKGIAFSSCISCHEDYHKGKLGTNCESCHNTASFRESTNLSTFDHNLTGFPLLGKHIDVNCANCHKTNLSSRPKHDLCFDCHEDYHKGQLTKNGRIQDCEKCHTVEGFSPSNYSIEQHNEGLFPLLESHLAVPCSDCHRKNEDWVFVFESSQCKTCHENVHGNSISFKFFGNSECKKCHTTESWSTIDFNHSLTSFDLIGKHKTTSCRDCHYVTDDFGIETHQFEGLNTECATCHEDIHQGQFTAESFVNCSECHTPNNWEPSKFNHDNTSFKLDGKHQNLECEACHKPITKKGVTFIQFKFESFKCADCHTS